MGEPGSDRKLAIVARHYALNAAGDHAAVRQLLTDDFVITIPDFMPFGGTYRGKDAFRDLIPAVRAAASVVAIKPIATSVDNDHVVEIVEFTLAGGEGPRPQVAELIRFRGDLICEIRPYYSGPFPFMVPAE